jgi:Beta-lactamase
MRRDTIFRIASMSKPITAGALLNKGQHGRERILSRRSVETMTSDFILDFWTLAYQAIDD